MFHVLTEHTEELLNGLFGRDRFLYTRRVSGPKGLTCWLLECAPRPEPAWRAAETQLIASLGVDAWVDRLSEKDVRRLYLLAPRNGEMTLTPCREVELQELPSGAPSLLFKLDEATVMVADSPPELGPCKSIRRVWASKRRPTAY